MNNVQSLDMTKIGVRTVEAQEYFAKCEICGDEVTGTSVKRLEWNLMLHKKQKHPIEYANVYARADQGTQPRRFKVKKE